MDRWKMLKACHKTPNQLKLCLFDIVAVPSSSVAWRTSPSSQSVYVCNVPCLSCLPNNWNLPNVGRCSVTYLQKIRGIAGDSYLPCTFTYALGEKLIALSCETMISSSRCWAASWVSTQHPLVTSTLWRDWSTHFGMRNSNVFDQIHYEMCNNYGMRKVTHILKLLQPSKTFDF